MNDKIYICAKRGEWEETLINTKKCFGKHNIKSPAKENNTISYKQHIFKNNEATGRIGKWSAKIANFAVEFTGRQTITSQAFANFIADPTLSNNNDLLLGASPTYGHPVGFISPIQPRKVSVNGISRRRNKGR